MSTLCFGGSFNPVHHGHLICARAVAERAGFDRVLLIPSAQPPHKSDVSQIADPTHRLEMCRLAVRGTAKFAVSDVEVTRQGPSYTLTTARQLKSQGWDEVSWLIGADMAKILPQWHQPEALMREVNFVLMARPGWTFDWQTLPEAYRHLKARVVSAPQIEMSATDLRARVAAGRSIDFMTPPAVVDYIRDHGLYRTNKEKTEG